MKSMNLGFPEMMFIFLLALLVFGPRKLPEIGRQIGKALADFKRYSNDFKYQLETEVRQWEIEETLRKEKDSLKEVLTVPPEGTVAGSSLSPANEPPHPNPYTEIPTEVISQPAEPPSEPKVENANSILPPSKDSNA